MPNDALIIPRCQRYRPRNKRRQSPHFMSKGEIIMKRSLIIFAFSLLIFTGVSVSAQDMAKPDNMSMDDHLPVVVFIRADWCPYCKKLEPKMAELQKQYSDRLKFVTLDITNGETSKKSESIAKDADVGEFFEANKKKASLVAIFKDKKQVYSTEHNTEDKDIKAAFDDALKGSMMQKESM